MHSILWTDFWRWKSWKDIIYIYTYPSLNFIHLNSSFKILFISAGPPAGCPNNSFPPLSAFKGERGGTFFRAITDLCKTGAVFCFLELFPFFRCDNHHTQTIIDSGLPREVLKTSAVDHRNSQTCRLCIFLGGLEVEGQCNPGGYTFDMP